MIRNSVSVKGDVAEDFFLVVNELINGLDEGILYFFFRQVWGLTVTLEFVIAAIDGSSVLVGRMPDLGPVPAAALAALNFAGEDGYAAVTSPAFTPPLDFFLHPDEDLRADDGFVVIFHIAQGLERHALIPHFPGTWKSYDAITFRSQDAQCPRKVFFFDQDVVCIVRGYRKDADLMFGKNPGQFRQDANERKVQDALNADITSPFR